MRCVRGAIFDVAVDVRPGSPTYKKWIAVELTADNKKALFIPEGLAHAYQALTDDTEVIYSSTCAYTPVASPRRTLERPSVRHRWPIADPIVSDKDMKWADFKG